MQPAQGLRFIHAAICHEVRAIEDQASTTESPEQLAALGARIAKFGQIVTLHAAGEEVSIYPDLEQRAPRVGATYLHDHRDERTLFEDLDARIAEARTASAATRAGLLARVRRQTIALTEHLLPHVQKEDELVTPLLIELFSPAEQGAQIGRMMGAFPQHVLAGALPWLVTSLAAEDRIAYMMMMQKVMPAERLGIACGWIRSGVAPEVWAAVTARLPELAS